MRSASATVGPPAVAAKGLLAMLGGTLLLTSQDAITKVLTADYHAGEIMFYRGLFSFLPIVMFVWMEGGVRCLRSRRPGLNFLRAVLALLTAVMIVTSFAYLPLADTLAMVFASPLIVTAMSGPLLGEAVDWRRWAAVGVGFLGVLLLTRPSATGIALIMLLPLATAFCGASRDVVTRKLGAFDSSTNILFWTQLVAVAATAPSLMWGAGWPGRADWLLFVLCGILNSFAHYLIITAFRLAPAASVAPFRYVALVWAVIMGAVFWGDRPDAYMLAGSLLIVGSGLYTLRRETRGRRSVPIPAATK